MMALLRLMAVLLALSLMLGEAYRSWGVDRPVAFWMDDQITGALLLLGAWLMARPSPWRYGLFAAGWGFNAGLTYSSFFGKLFTPDQANAGNFDLGHLTALVGLAFFASLIGLAATLWLAYKARGQALHRPGAIKGRQA